MFRKSIILIAICIVPVFAWAAFPDPAGFVTDSAGVMDAKTRADLESFLTSFEKQTGVEIAIATVPSLDEMSIDDYAVRLYEKWGIGKRGKDDGILFLIAPDERQMRIEVGYGLEGAINDALAGRILDESVIPFFKQGDLSGGIASGTLAIVDNIVTKENLSFDPKQEIAAYENLPQGRKETGGPLRTIGKILTLLVMIYLFIRHPWLFLFFLSASGGGGRSSGGFGGGFRGFGGGLSGGGGASRGW